MERVYNIHHNIYHILMNIYWTLIDWHLEYLEKFTIAFRVSEILLQLTVAILYFIAGHILHVLRQSQAKDKGD